MFYPHAPTYLNANHINTGFPWQISLCITLIKEVCYVYANVSDVRCIHLDLCTFLTVFPMSDSFNKSFFSSSTMFLLQIKQAAKWVLKLKHFFLIAPQYLPWLLQKCSTETKPSVVVCWSVANCSLNHSSSLIFVPPAFSVGKDRRCSSLRTRNTSRSTAISDNSGSTPRRNQARS